MHETTLARFTGRSSALLALCLGALIFTTACDKKEKTSNNTSATANGTTAASDTTKKDEGAAKTAEAPKINEELMADLKGIASTCEVNVDGNNFKCKAEEDKKLKDKFYKKKIDRIESLDTFAAALSDPDEKLQVVASSIMYSVVSSFQKAKPGDVSEATAKRLLTALEKAPKYRAAQALRTVVYAATLANIKDDLYKVLDGHSYKHINAAGYEHVMHYGRLAHFDKIKEQAKSEDKNTARSAFRGVLNMPKMTDAEKDTVCPWAKGYLSSERDEQFFGAGRVAIKCRGEYVDALLEEGEKRAKEHKFTRDYTMVYRDICFSMVPGLMKEAGVKEQCERNYKLLESVVNDEKTDSLARGLALFGIYYQRRNEESYKLMQKYKNHKDENVKKYANESIESLEKHYLKDKKKK